MLPPESSLLEALVDKGLALLLAAPLGSSLKVSPPDVSFSVSCGELTPL